MYDALIIGSGAAGLTLALNLPQTMRIVVLSKETLTQSNTLYAQGGISAVLDNNDSKEAHIQDTLKAGAGLCDEQAVRFTVEGGKAAIEWLIEKGVAFTQESELEHHNPPRIDDLHLTKEGGHSHRRVAHAADATGKEIETSLVKKAEQRSNIELLDHHIAIDLITSRKLRHKGQNRCMGAYALDRKSNKVKTIQSRFVILATGGGE